jgi:8-oxo-dGTP pyrophosphatase MutT (NUDIX family)
VPWSHFGGTWGLPGGARHEGESATDAAFREAYEEAEVPRDHLEVLFESVFDLGFWSYTTVAGRVISPFDARVADVESIELRWTPVAEVTSLPLHPGFAVAWPTLRERL